MFLLFWCSLVEWNSRYLHGYNTAFRIHLFEFYAPWRTRCETALAPRSMLIPPPQFFIPLPPPPSPSYANFGPIHVSSPYPTRSIPTPCFIPLYPRAMLICPTPHILSPLSLRSIPHVSSHCPPSYANLPDPPCFIPLIPPIYVNFAPMFHSPYPPIYVNPPIFYPPYPSIYPPCFIPLSPELC